jgi:hypothetical protein
MDPAVVQALVQQAAQAEARLAQIESKITGAHLQRHTVMQDACNRVLHAQPVRPEVTIAESTTAGGCTAGGNNPMGLACIMAVSSKHQVGGWWAKGYRSFPPVHSSRPVSSSTNSLLNTSMHIGVLLPVLVGFCCDVLWPRSWWRRVCR